MFRDTTRHHLFRHYSIGLTRLCHAHSDTIPFGSSKRLGIGLTSLVILLKSDPNRFSAHVTLKFGSWPRKTIGSLFHASRSYVYHFIAIHELKVKLSSRNATIGAKSVDFSVHVSLKFDGSHRKIIEPIFYATSSFVYHFSDICEFKFELQSGNA